MLRCLLPFAAFGPHTPGALLRLLSSDSGRLLITRVARLPGAAGCGCPLTNGLAWPVVPATALINPRGFAAALIGPVAATGSRFKAS
jgi:hypothetical protein